MNETIALCLEIIFWLALFIEKGSTESKTNHTVLLAKPYSSSNPQPIWATELCFTFSLS